MVKSGRHQLVQVIEVNTISDGLIWHPLPPSVMHWEQHRIILGVSLLGIESPNPCSPWILIILEQMFLSTYYRIENWSTEVEQFTQNKKW